MPNICLCCVVIYFHNTYLILRIIGLRKLEVLNLNQVTIIGSTLLQSLGALPSLKILSLQYNNLSSTSISQVTFFNMTTLEELYLDGSALPINFVQNIGQLPALKILSVRDCDLTGTLPTEVTFFNMTTLEELYLDRSALPINFVQNIGQLPALKILSVRDCDLTGTLPTEGKSTPLPSAYNYMINERYSISSVA
ncbi:LEUCINE-RICH REPEAT SERINE/THREONINE-PROTEIN KINASE 1 [Salix purpurea]|uniref:LEUCINE-RICH REPEAT SERINE/THREONINE-PROTEIN KINASE 1 n=1 Tax=Salix purpurea TaxID=77065 RepID=A0A9Q1ALA2_SALPP|nr:LEUCINE-RICH REPEAT SERINE/THREONINE-PROTEIN KINASE 1 [Salix purpurea]